jgi:cysteine desulfuration protein SufE
MDVLRSLDLTESQTSTVEDYLALDTAEDRLNWLFERTPLIPPLPDALRTDERRIKGCQSGLWIQGEVQSGVYTFRSYSDSKMVQGVASFLCDLYSGRTAEQIQAMNYSFVSVLGLEALLSITRKRAVASVYTYIHGVAAGAARSAAIAAS